MNRLQMRLAVIGAAPLLAVGCVAPDPANPWSTKAKSIPGGSQIREVVLARPVLDTVVSARSRAIAVLRRAVDDKHPLLRATGFEGLQAVPEVFVELAPIGLADENRAVRFVTAMSAGDVAERSLSPFLEPLVMDPSASVQAAAIYALRSFGSAVDPTPLAECVMDPDPEVRANAYVVLGRLGNDSAQSMIDTSLAQDLRRASPMRLRLAELQAAAALVRLGRESMVEPIRAALFAPPEQAERTLLACNLLGDLGDEGGKPMLARLLLARGPHRRPIEIRMAAATALMQLDPPRPEKLTQVLLEGLADDDARRRVQATAGLAVAIGPDVESVLAILLEDSDPLVATTAAGALLARSPSLTAEGR